MVSRDALNIAINVQVSPGGVGGVFQSTAGLIRALGKLDDGPEKYTLVIRSAELSEWIEPYRSEPAHRSQAAAGGYKRGQKITGTDIVKLALGPLLPLARNIQHLLSVPRQWPEVPVSDGFMESIGCDVVHFPTQGYALCALPTIYNPHDLQHLHYPQFFTPAELTYRETIYPAACHFSQTVVVGTQWIKDDVVLRYAVDPDKVQVIPWASPTQFYREANDQILVAVAQKYRLEQPFILYPAVTWPHKNHLRLLDAIARIRDNRGLELRLVCTGSPDKSFQPRIDKRVRELNLTSQVKFLGFVPEEELRALYRLASQ